nr:MAG TPA: hypothetical protein [Caudoviricetes sp.]
MTVHGHRAKILCFDKKGELPIVATIDFEDHEVVYDYAEDGTMPHPAPLRFTLVMRDDDYLEKLERGEYAPSVKENLTVENPTCKESLPVDREYWRRVYAGQAMAGQIAGVIARGAVKRTGKDTPHVITEAAVLFADALIEELEKTEKQRPKL